MRKANKSALHFINEVAGKSRLYIIFLLLVQIALRSSSGAAYLHFPKAAKEAAQADAGKGRTCPYLFAGASWKLDDCKSIWQGSGQPY